MQATASWVAAVIAVVVVVVVAIVIAIFWNELGASEISLAGWLALGGGVVVTLTLGCGLMALMFFSNRRGYDYRAHRDGD
jgi:hypothetical protein